MSHPYLKPIEVRTYAPAPGKLAYGIFDGDALINGPYVYRQDAERDMAAIEAEITSLFARVKSAPALTETEYRKEVN